MGLDKRTTAKLASLSALGAGTLILASPEQAEASVIMIDVNQTVSTAGAPGPHVWLSGALGFPGGPQLAFGVFKSTCGCVGTFAKYFVGKARGDYFSSLSSVPRAFLQMSVRGSRPYLALFSKGAYFPGYAGAVPFPLTIGGLYQSFQTATPTVPTATSPFGNLNFAQRFAFFSFFDTVNSHWDYGWIQISQQFNGTDLSLTIHDFAYDDQGNFLAAGQVPEPGTLGSMAMGALVLGAVGLRRWRAARKSE